MGEREPSPEEGAYFRNLSGWQRALDTARASPERRQRAPGLMGTLDTVMDLLAGHDPPDPLYAPRIMANGVACDYQAFWPKDPDDPKNARIQIAEFYKARKGLPTYRVELEREAAPDVGGPARAFDSEAFVLRFREDGVMTDYRYENNTYESPMTFAPPIEGAVLSEEDRQALTAMDRELRSPAETLEDLTTVLSVIERQLLVDVGA